MRIVGSLLTLFLVLVGGYFCLASFFEALPLFLDRPDSDGMNGNIRAEGVYFLIEMFIVLIGVGLVTEGLRRKVTEEVDEQKRLISALITELQANNHNHVDAIERLLEDVFTAAAREVESLRILPGGRVRKSRLRRTIEKTLDIVQSIDRQVEALAAAPMDDARREEATKLARSITDPLSEAESCAAKILELYADDNDDARTTATVSQLPDYPALRESLRQSLEDAHIALTDMGFGPEQNSEQNSDQNSEQNDGE